MSSNLKGQTVVVIGGSSGMGYGVAKASLLQHATHVIIGSSSKDKVEDALKRLNADVANASVEGGITGDVIDGKDATSVRRSLRKTGRSTIWSGRVEMGLVTFRTTWRRIRVSQTFIFPTHVG